MLGGSLSHTPFFLKRGLSLNLALPSLTSLANQQAQFQSFACLCPHSAGRIDMYHHTWL